MALVDNAWYVNSVSYAAITAWGAAASKVCGNIVRQTAPAVGSERAFVCIASTGGTGQTGGGEPTWVTTRGGLTTDNTLTWQECTGIAALNGDLTNTPNWNTVKNTAITLGQVITNNAGNLVLICTIAGTAGNGAEPSWAAFTNAGATTADNAATWVTLGASFSAWSAPHDRIGNCCTATWQQAGNDVYVGDNHAESQSTAININVQAAAGKTQRILSVDHAGAIPPTGVKSGASVSISGTGNVALTLGNSTAGGGIGTYVQGITLNGSNNTGGGAIINFNSSANNTSMCYRDCSFSAQGSGGFNVNPNTGNSALCNFLNCNWTFNPHQVSAGNEIVYNGGRGRHRGGTVTQTSGNPNVIMVSSQTVMDAVWEAVDFSGVNPPSEFYNDTGTVGRLIVKNCKLASIGTVGSGGTAGPFTDTALATSDPAAANVAGSFALVDSRIYVLSGTGTLRTGGAPVSWNIKANSTLSYWQPGIFIAPIAIWNPTVGAPVTITMYGAGSSIPTTDQLGFDVRYLGDSGSCLGSTSYGYQNDPLAAGSNWTTDSGSSWTGSPANKFKLSVTFTPQKAGFLFIHPRIMSVASGINWNLDPLPTLSSVPAGRYAPDYDGYFSLAEIDNQNGIFSLGLEEVPSNLLVYGFNMPMMGR